VMKWRGWGKGASMAPLATTAKWRAGGGAY
jgi:hypothetical protein